MATTGFFGTGAASSSFEAALFYAAMYIGNHYLYLMNAI